jgi:hypothetical protein
VWRSAYIEKSSRHPTVPLNSCSTVVWPAGQTNVEHEFRGTVGWSDDFSIYADLNKGLIKQGDKTIAGYDFNGSKQGGDYNFEISKFEIGPEFNAKALARWIPEQKIRAGKIQVHQSELILPRIGAGSFQGHIEFNGFVLEPGSTRKTPTALDTTLTVDATAKDRIFQINDFTALLPGTEKTVNKAKVSGKLNLSQMQNPRADLKLYSNELDITPLMDLLLNNKPDSRTGVILQIRSRFLSFRFRNDISLSRWHRFVV